MERCWRPLLDIKFQSDFQRSAEQVYKEHNAVVREAAPKDKFLEWTVSQGWEPLCKFLDVTVPGEPFPSRNAAEGYEKTVGAIFEPPLKRATRNPVLWSLLWLRRVATGIGGGRMGSEGIGVCAIIRIVSRFADNFQVNVISRWPVFVSVNGWSAPQNSLPPLVSPRIETGLCH